VLARGRMAHLTAQMERTRATHTRMCTCLSERQIPLPKVTRSSHGPDECNAPFFAELAAFSARGRRRFEQKLGVTSMQN
jgi:hypothetical protein